MISLRSSAFITFILGLFVLLQTSGSPLQRTASSSPILFINTVEGEDISTAEQTLAVELFTRFNCRECQRVAREVLPQMKIFYEEMPLAPFKIHVTANSEIPEESDPAKGLYCAEQQQKYWEMHDALYALESPITAVQAQEQAQNLELDMAAYASCLEAPETAQALASAAEKAAVRQIDAYPTILINQHRLLGFQPWENVKRIIKNFQ